LTPLFNQASLVAWLVIALEQLILNVVLDKHQLRELHAREQDSQLAKMAAFVRMGLA
jgi:hypothetical protein